MALYLCVLAISISIDTNNILHLIHFTNNYFEPFFDSNASLQIFNSALTPTLFHSLEHHCEYETHMIL